MLTEAAAAMIVCLSVVGCVGGDEGIFYTGGVLGSTISKTGTGGETPGPTGQSPSSSSALGPHPQWNYLKTEVNQIHDNVGSWLGVKDTREPNIEDSEATEDGIYPANDSKTMWGSASPEMEHNYNFSPDILPSSRASVPKERMDDSEEGSHFGSRALNFLAIFKHLANYSSASKVADYPPVSERTDNIMAISRKASPTQRTSTASGTEKPVNTVVRYKFNGHVYATRVVPLRVTSVAPPAATPVVQSSILIVQRARTNCPPGQRHAGGKCRAEWRW